MKTRAFLHWTSSLFFVLYFSHCAQTNFCKQGSQHRNTIKVHVHVDLSGFLFCFVLFLQIHNWRGKIWLFMTLMESWRMLSLFSEEQDVQIEKSSVWISCKLIILFYVWDFSCCWDRKKITFFPFNLNVIFKVNVQYILFIKITSIKGCLHVIVGICFLCSAANNLLKTTTSTWVTSHFSTSG